MEEVCPTCGTRMIYPDGSEAVCPNCGYVGPPLAAYMPPRRLELPRPRPPPPSKYAAAVRELARRLGISGGIVDVAANAARQYGAGFPPHAAAAAALYLLGAISFAEAARLAPRRLVWRAALRLAPHLRRAAKAAR